MADIRKFKYGAKLGNFYIFEVFEEKLDRFVAIANNEDDAANITSALNQYTGQSGLRSTARAKMSSNTNAPSTSSRAG